MGPGRKLCPCCQTRRGSWRSFYSQGSNSTWRRIKCSCYTNRGRSVTSPCCIGTGRWWERQYPAGPPRPCLPVPSLGTPVLAPPTRTPALAPQPEPPVLLSSLIPRSLGPRSCTGSPRGAG
ncbi:hypothetical protein DPEC_G00243840 [Dallia pectoralis]|uniref:Uncharacterized protein n=1 Tax=Dallia pectoralis TaxID=75939 RepID=A0ACC2FVI5_DALPE|nr:hypothetical protein DPEC_G00243840 [Dallia pectoralis]